MLQSLLCTATAAALLPFGSALAQGATVHASTMSVGDTVPPASVAIEAPFVPTDTRPLPARFRGLVLLDDGSYGTEEEALARGMTRYRGRWLTRKLARKTKRWESQLRRIDGWEDARDYRARHYRIKTDLPPHVVELDVIPFLDALYETYKDVFRTHFGARGSAASNKDIAIYRNYEEYAFEESHADGTLRPRSNPAFIRGGQHLVTFWDETDPDAFYKNVFHEAGHQFVKALYPGVDLPKWLDEGIASYFEGCRWSPSRQEVTFEGTIAATRLGWARQLLARAKRRGLKDGFDSFAQQMILTISDDNFGASEYALSATFVHYLIHRCKDMRRGAFARFLDQMNGAGTRPIEESWKRATRTDFNEIATGWSEYVADLPRVEAPEWCAVAPEHQGELDVHAGDHIHSIDGCQVFDALHFAELWDRRDKSATCELVLVRRGDEPGRWNENHEFVTVLVPEDSKLDLAVSSTMGRTQSIVD